VWQNEDATRHTQFSDPLSLNSVSTQLFCSQFKTGWYYNGMQYESVWYCQVIDPFSRFFITSSVISFGKLGRGSLLGILFSKFTSTSPQNDESYSRTSQTSSLLLPSRLVAHHSALRRIHASRRSSGCIIFVLRQNLKSWNLRSHFDLSPKRYTFFIWVRIAVLVIKSNGSRINRIYSPLHER